MQYTINVSKANKTLVVDWDSLTAEVQGNIIRHGLTQKINDAHASEPDADEAFKKAKAVCDNIVSGIWGKAREGNPIRTELRAMLVAAAQSLNLGKKADLIAVKFDDLVAKIAKAKSTTSERVLEVFTPKAEAKAEAKRIENAARKADAIALSADLDDLE